jgi:hypothetical protein
VDKVKQLAIDQMELFDKRRNRIIGALVAVYVPLAFATVSHDRIALKSVVAYYQTVFFRDEHRR